MEKEGNGEMTFLEFLVNSRNTETLGYYIYQKPTHTNRNLHKVCNPNLVQKRGNLKTLDDCATLICDTEHLSEELKPLEEDFQADGYSSAEIKRTLHLHYNSRYIPLIKQLLTTSHTDVCFISNHSKCAILNEKHIISATMFEILTKATYCGNERIGGLDRIRPCFFNSCNTSPPASCHQ